MRTQWISRPDAAKILGVTAQTISNYASRGLLHEKSVGQLKYYPKQEIDQMLEIPEVVSIERMKKEIPEIEEQVRSQYERVRLSLDNAKEVFYGEFGGQVQWSRYKEVVMALFRVCATDLPNRDRQIIEDILACIPISRVADIYGLSVNRVRGVFQRALRRMMTFPKRLQDREDELRAKVAKAEADVLKMKNECERLEARLYQAEHPGSKIVIPKKVDYVASYPYNVKLSDCAISVRLFNCLHSMDIDTLGQLALRRRIDLMKIRNFGRKCVSEYEQLMWLYGFRQNKDGFYEIPA